MRSDRDKRSETEKEIDEFLSKFESPDDGSSADYSTYLEPEESAASDGPSFNWKDVESDELIQESSGVLEAEDKSEKKPEAKKPEIRKPEAKKPEIRKPEAKKPEKKKKSKKYPNKPGKLTAQDIEELKEEIKEELEEIEIKEAKEAKTPDSQMQTKVKTEPAPVKPAPVKEEKAAAAPYKAGRKKRRNKDVRRTSPSVPAESKAAPVGTKPEPFEIKLEPIEAKPEPKVQDDISVRAEVAKPDIKAEAPDLHIKDKAEPEAPDSQTQTKDKTEPAPVKPAPVKEEKAAAAPYKAGRKKRRNKDVRRTSPSVPAESKAEPIEAKPEPKTHDDISDISVIAESTKPEIKAETPDLPIKDKAELVSASSGKVEDVARTVLVSGAGADMSKYGKKKKKSGKKQSRSVSGEKSSREVIKGPEKDVKDVKDVKDIKDAKDVKKTDSISGILEPDDFEYANKKRKQSAESKKAGKTDGTEKTDEKKSGADGSTDKKSDKKSDEKAVDKKSGTKKSGKKLKEKSALLRKTSGVKKKLEKRKGDRTLSEFLFLKPNPDYDPSKGDTYEKDGKTIKNKKNRVSFLKILGNIAAVFLVFVLAGMIYALGCIISAPKYDYKDIYSVVDTSSVIYDDQGEPIDNVFYTENRKIIKYDDMPENLINSFVAIEDKTFWKHHGFNWTRMIGAIISSLTGNGKISGTSTITQQLARNVYLADTKSVRSIKRKLLEMYYAARIEHSLSKKQIIEAYLNTIYLGHGCYGVNAAAKTYFSKDVPDLDLVECASLAALPQSPDTYALLKLSSEAQDAVDPKVVATEPDTIVTNDIARGRRQLTLDLMLDQGLISKADHDKVYDLPLNDFIDPTISNVGSDYSYFHEYLVDTVINDLVEQRKMTYEDAERMVYTRGLQIYSTVDSTAQKVIVQEFRDDSNFPYVDPPRDADGNILNSDGEIAMYNYDNDFDENGNFTLSGEAGDVKVNSDGSITIIKGQKLHIYETDVDGSTDYSIEFRSYYLYDEDDTLYSIAGGYINIPMDYKSLDSGGNVVVSADYFKDPTYSSNVEINGNDVIFKPGSYSLSSKSRQPQAAMTIVGVGTGEVKAMVGGRTTGGQKLLNRSLNARQPGSSIKPLAVYGAALQKSYELERDGQKWKFTDFGIDKQGTKGWGDYITCHSSVEDERLRIEGRYWPNNFGNTFSGTNNFVTAVQRSINTCAVKILLQVGADYSVSQLQKFGITTLQDDTSNPVNDVNPAALALGAMTEGVQPLEMALAYAAFPGGGKVNTPVCYYKVLDRNGEVLLESKSEQSEALDEGVAWIMTNVLQSVVSSNGYMYVEGFSPGGKTGTTNDEYDIWFDGFSPTYAASLWIGTDENVSLNTASTPAARLWGKIMNQIPAAAEGEYREQPSNVIYTAGDYFTEGTETGLSSWSEAAERKKAEEARQKAIEQARQAAYEQWLVERESHKKKVIDVPAGTKKELVTPEQSHIEKVLVGYEQKLVVDKEAYDEEVVDPATGKTTKIHHDAVTHYEDDTSKPIYEERKVVDKPAVYKDVPVPEVSHEEYEEGWRDGDFKFDASAYD